MSIPSCTSSALISFWLQATVDQRIAAKRVEARDELVDEREVSQSASDGNLSLSGGCEECGGCQSVGFSWFGSCNGGSSPAVRRLHGPSTDLGICCQLRGNVASCQGHVPRNPAGHRATLRGEVCFCKFSFHECSILDRGSQPAGSRVESQDCHILSFAGCR